MDPGKIDRIVKWPAPKNCTELNRFIGMIQYYRRYVSDMSTLLSPLNYLKKKNVQYIWGDDQQASFEECKRRLLDDVILIHPDFSKPFVLFTDASGIGIGGCLMQEVEEGEGGDNSEIVLRPIYFGSKALNDAEKKTSIYEREFLAIVYFVHYFKKFLLAQKFTVITDQKSLQYLIKFNEDVSAKVIRWQLSLSQYDFDILYRPGKMNVNADAMSRLPPSISEGAPELNDILEDQHLSINAIRKYEEVTKGWEEQVMDSMNKKKLKTEGEMDGEAESADEDGVHGMAERDYLNLVTYLVLWKYPEDMNERQRKALRSTAKKYIVREGNVLYRKPNSESKGKDRKVLRRNEVVEVLANYHDHLLAGHQGIQSTFNKIKESYYWPNYYETVREFVLSRKTCQNFGPRDDPVPIELKRAAINEPFGQITMDYISVPLTEAGNTSCLVMVCMFSGWVECYPSPVQTAGFTAMCLFKWICTYGCPSRVYCDNGSHFVAKEVMTMMKASYGIKVSLGIPHHPQGQGKVERTNREIKKIMYKYIGLYAQDWDVWLPALLYVVRSAKRRDHGYSSFYLVYGRDPRYTMQVAEEIETGDMELEEDELVMTRIERIKEKNDVIIPTAIRNLTVYRQKMKNQYNKKTKDKRFYVGELVMVNRVNTKEMLMNKWDGPYEVIEVVKNNAYKLKDRELELPSLFHANELKLFRRRHRMAMPVKDKAKGN